MTIISKPSSTFKPKADREPSEYDGMWINVGVNVQNPETGETSFVRLSRGIAVSDLQPKKIYPNMTPEYASQLQIENQMLKEIQEAAMNLKEGEALSTDALSVQVYRRNEEVQAAASTGGVSLGLFSD